MTTSPQGVDVQNLIKLSSAIAALRMREITGFCVGFFCLHIRLSIDRSIYLIFTKPTGHIFSAILTLNSSYDVFLQPLVPFEGRDEMAPHLGGQIPQKPTFWGREWALSSQTRKILKLAYYRNYCIDSNQIMHSD